MGCPCWKGSYQSGPLSLLQPGRQQDMHPSYRNGSPGMVNQPPVAEIGPDPLTVDSQGLSLETRAQRVH
jgi:hypothetical protein